MHVCTPQAAGLTVRESLPEGLQAAIVVATAVHFGIAPSVLRPERPEGVPLGKVLSCDLCVTCWCLRGAYIMCGGLCAQEFDDETFHEADILAEMVRKHLWCTCALLVVMCTVSHEPLIHPNVCCLWRTTGHTQQHCGDAGAPVLLQPNQRGGCFRARNRGTRWHTVTQPGLLFAHTACSPCVTNNRHSCSRSAGSS